MTAVITFEFDVLLDLALALFKRLLTAENTVCLAVNMALFVAFLALHAENTGRPLYSKDADVNDTLYLNQRYVQAAL